MSPATFRSIGIGVGVTAAIGLLGFLLSSSSLPAQPPPAKKTVWEYCELFRTWDPVSKEPFYRLSLPSERIQTKSAKELGGKLGDGNCPDKTFAVLNILGMQGWELVTCVEYESARDVRHLIQSWTFKRPK